MNAMEIGPTDTVSAAMPPKGSVSAPSSDMAEEFGLQWRQDIAEADADVPAPYSMPANPDAGSDQNGRVSILTDATNNDPNGPGESANRVSEGTRDRKILPGAAPNASVDRGVRGAERTTAERLAGTEAMPGTPSVTSNPKRALKTSEPADSSEVLNAQNAAALPGTVAAMLGVEENVPAPEHLVQIPLDISSENSRTKNALTSETKINQPLAGLQVGKQTPAKVGPVESGSAMHGTAVATAPSGSPAGSSTASSAFASGSSTNLDPSSSMASGSHLIQAGVLSATGQTLTLNHAALSSAQSETLIRGTVDPDATGLGSPHILSSGPAQLDVGVMDSTHGWLQIRAELGNGGAISASLTAGVLADESLRASLPEMAKYLRSEEVSVSSLDVHRFSEDANRTPTSMSEGQPNGNTQGHHPGGDEQSGGTGSQKDQLDGIGQPPALSTSVTTSSLAGRNVANVAVSSGWAGESTRSTPGLFWPLGVPGGDRGNWLNVTA